MNRSNIKQALKESGKTQVFIARKTGLSDKSISRALENPERSNFKTLALISKHIGNFYIVYEGVTVNFNLN